jgi:hypothetical protein
MLGLFRPLWKDEEGVLGYESPSPSSLGILTGVSGRPGKYTPFCLANHSIAACSYDTGKTMIYLKLQTRTLKILHTLGGL